MSAFDGGNDRVGVFGPGKWLGSDIVFGEVAIDGSLEVDNAFEDPALEPTLGEDGKEAFDGVEPGS